MRYILILLLLVGTAYGQSSPTSAKTRFVNGLYMGTKLDSYFAAADSNAIYWRADSVVMAKYKGAARALAFAVSGGYLPISDTAAMLSGYKTYYPRTAISAGTGISYNPATGVITNSSPSSGGTVTSVATNNGSGITGGTITSTGTIAADTSILSTKANVTGTLVGYTTLAQNALKLNISDTATMLSNYRRKTTLIENSDLRNSAITINGSSTSLGSSISVGTVTSVAASAGTGISVSGSPITSSGTITITNTAPDQTVGLTGGTGISISGTYPNFTITNSSPSSGGTVTSVSAGTGMSFTTITSTGAVNADTTTLATRAYVVGLDVGKANTSLNNVNGVLGSNFGGAGSVSGILKADGSGVVSPVIASDITTLISGTYLPLSGGTLTGALSGTSAAFSGSGSFGALTVSSGTASFNSNLNMLNGSVVIRNNANTAAYGSIARSGLIEGNSNTEMGIFAETGFGINFYTGGSATVRQRISPTGNTLIKTTTDNGTDALQVAGSALVNTLTATAGVTVPNGTSTFTASSNAILDVVSSRNSNSGTSAISRFSIGNNASTNGFTIRLHSSTHSTSPNIVQIYNEFDANLELGGYGATALTLGSGGAATFSSSVTANSFVKSGGTSSQFLKADGSVDGSTYVNTSSTQSVGGNKTFTSSTVFAGVRFAYSSVSSNYTLTDNDDYVVVTNTSTVTLPTAVGRAGKRYVIRSTAGSGVTSTLATTSSQTVDGAAGSFSFGNGNYNILIVFSDGANWLSEQWITGS